jgi:hypothetical protein
MEVSHNLTRSQKETAAGHQGFAIRVVGRDGHNGWFYSLYKGRKGFLRVSRASQKEN